MPPCILSKFNISASPFGCQLWINPAKKKTPTSAMALSGVLGGWNPMDELELFGLRARDLLDRLQRMELAFEGLVVRGEFGAFTAIKVP